METMIKKENKQEAISVAETIQKMSTTEQKNLAAFITGIQYATVLQGVEKINKSEAEEITEAV